MLFIIMEKNWNFFPNYFHFVLKLPNCGLPHCNPFGRIATITEADERFDLRQFACFAHGNGKYLLFFIRGILAKDDGDLWGG